MTDRKDAISAKTIAENPVVIPVAILLVYWVLPVQNADVVMAAYLAAATSAGAYICALAQQYDCDYEFSVVTVCLSTLLSIVTVPLLATLAQVMF